MLKDNLGFRCKQCTSHLSLLLKNVIYLLPAITVFTVMPAKAAYVCQQYESCAMINRGYYWERVCKPAQNCTWVPDAPPIPSPPPSMPPTWTPPPHSPPPPPAIKSPEDIEREQHVKFCKEYPSQIKSAVDTCTSMAKSFHGYFVATKCSGVTSQTWNVKFSVKDIFDAGYSQTIEPGPTCREDAKFAMEATIARCDAGGSKYQAALIAHCSDVN